MKKNNFCLLIASLVIFISAIPIYAEEINEDTTESIMFNHSVDLYFNNKYLKKNTTSFFYNSTTDTISEGTILTGTELKLSQITNDKKIGMAINAYLNPTVTQNSLTFMLNELYFRCKPIESLDLQLGKFSLGWGFGYFNNPTNIIDRKKDFVNERSIKEGSYIYKADVNLFENVSLSTICFPDPNLLNLGIGSKLSGYIPVSKMDVDIIGYYKSSELSLGFECRGDFMDITYYFEGYCYKTNTLTYIDSHFIYQKFDQTPNLDFVIGTSYLSENKTFGVLEYYKKLGFDSEKWQQYCNAYEASPNNIGMIKNLYNPFMRTDYLLFLISQSEIFQYYMCQYYGILCLNDASLLNTIKFQYSQNNYVIDLIFEYTLPSEKYSISYFYPNAYDLQLNLRFLF